MSLSEPLGQHTPTASLPCVTDVARQPAHRSLDFTGNLLAPLCLAGCAANVALARQTADETVASYEARTAEDLATIGQLIALGIVALDTRRLSMDESLSVTMRLRLRNCENTMNRSIRQHNITWQKTRAQWPPLDLPQHAAEDPSASQDLDGMIARAQGMLENLHVQVASLHPLSCAARPAAAESSSGVAGCAAAVGQPPPPHPVAVTAPAIVPTPLAAAKSSSSAPDYPPPTGVIPTGVISVSIDGASAATGADTAPSMSQASAQQAAIAGSADSATAAPASVPPKPDKPQDEPPASAVSANVRSRHQHRGRRDRGRPWSGFSPGPSGDRRFGQATKANDKGRSFPLLPSV